MVDFKVMVKNIFDLILSYAIFKVGRHRHYELYNLEYVDVF